MSERRNKLEARAGVVPQTFLRVLDDRPVRPQTLAAVLSLLFFARTTYRALPPDGFDGPASAANRVGTNGENVMADVLDETAHAMFFLFQLTHIFRAGQPFRVSGLVRRPGRIVSRA